MVAALQLISQGSPRPGASLDLGTMPPTVGTGIPVAITRHMTEAQWQTYRRAMRSIGGSDIGALMGFSPYADAYTLARKLKGLDPVDDKPSPNYMRRGDLAEPHILRALALHLGLRSVRAPRTSWYCRRGTIRPVGLTLAHPTVSHMHAHLDGVLRYPSAPASIPDGAQHGEAAVVEFKFVNSFKVRDTRDAIDVFAETMDPTQVLDTPVASWWAQIQANMAVTGWSHAWLAVMLGPTPLVDGLAGYEPDMRDYRFVRIPRDEAFIEAVEGAVAAFWTRFVEGDELPEPSARSFKVLRGLAAEANLDGEEEMPELEDDLVEARSKREERLGHEKAAKAAKKAEEGAKARITKAMVDRGVETALVGDRKVTLKTNVRGVTTLRV